MLMSMLTEQQMNALTYTKRFTNKVRHRRPDIGMTATSRTNCQHPESFNAAYRLVQSTECPGKLPNDRAIPPKTKGNSGREQSKLSNNKPAIDGLQVMAKTMQHAHV